VKLFGEYLVQKGLVNKDALADALVEQVSRMPTYTELAWKAKALNSDSLLSLLKTQAEKKSGFVEAAQQLGLWSAQLETVLADGARRNRVPIGEILVNRGLLTPESLAHALDEFLGEVSDVKPAPAASSGAPAAVSVATTPSAVAGKQSFYSEAFGPELKEQLLALAKSVTEAKSGAAVKELFDCVHRVKGAARMADEKATEELCGKLEESLKLLIPKKELSSDLTSNLKQAADACIAVLLELREWVLKGSNEQAYLADAAGAESMKKASGLADLLKFDAEMAGG
jgi:HPt (histidine-containing phosphotransfer) domain-containing protein